MRATLHSEYEQEKAKLAYAVSAIKKRLSWGSMEDGDGMLGADEWSSHVLAQWAEQRRRAYEAALLEPFFARVDWLESQDGCVHIAYFGGHEITEVEIYSWASPIAKMLFYQPSISENSSRRLLRRTFVIDEGLLHDIFDEYVASDRHLLVKLPIQQQSAENAFVDSLLQQMLKSPHSDKMKEIVATIQDRQYRLVSSPETNLVVINGTAGSGKTAIAAHRLPYLLYVNRDNRDFRSDRLLFLGPTALLLNYIGNVMPKIGGSGIKQQTFDHFLTSQASLHSPHLEPEDTLEGCVPNLGKGG